MHKSRAPRRPGDRISYFGAQYLWALFMELAPCDRYGVWSFEMATKFKKKFVALLYSEKEIDVACTTHERWVGKCI
jgi:hypothetical protein